MASYVDETLEKQLAQAGSDELVGAVFTLSGAERDDRSAEETKQLVGQLVRESEQVSRTKAERVSLFLHMQSFAVNAPASFIRALVKSDKIGTAIANVQEEDLLIRPVAHKAAKKKSRP